MIDRQAADVLEACVVGELAGFGFAHCRAQARAAFGQRGLIPSLGNRLLQHVDAAGPQQFNDLISQSPEAGNRLLQRDGGWWRLLA